VTSDSHTTFDSLDATTIDALARRFRTAQPFPHVVIDDVLRGDPGDLLASYPPPDWSHWGRFRDEYQRGKLFCDDIEVIPEPWAAIVRELSAPRFLETLEAITGVDALIPDPYLEGGGLHCSEAGGVLAPHTDFHVYRRLGLFRRVNVLLYLNPGWTTEAGGCPELWRKGATAPDATIVPEWGRCVIFATDDRSVHGFSPTATRDDAKQQWRRSIALYYYTSAEQPEFSGDTTTYWQQHGDGRGWRGVRIRAYQALLFVSRGFAFLAHRANPNRARPQLAETRPTAAPRPKGKRRQ
jgi:2OG-Fe(II) oxygenase superfamily